MMRWGIILLFGLLATLGFYCSSNQQVAIQSPYLNHHDSVQYVGMDVCKQCHSSVHESFQHTGMGKSFDLATREKSSADFSKNHVIYDAKLDLTYTPFWKDNTLFIREFRIVQKDTVHNKVQRIDYIIGSGQHTNSHLYQENGYLFQAPLTYYTQDGKWDLPPGFENGFNTRFNRIIGLECMSCHNAYPEFVKGSENKFTHVPNGIDCERCHGPGSLHVANIQKGILVDTALYIDYSIVNPGKLPIDLQFDLCQRCHLQGNAVLAEGKSFYDFKPGMALKDVMRVFLPRYENADNQFIMASHADRLKQSACFKVMASRHSNDNELRPYKNALTCVSCHNPHVSVKNSNPDVFNAQCRSCHSSNQEIKCSENPTRLSKANNDCVSCHMPMSGSIDIPHVRVHDHYIRKNPEVYTETNHLVKGRFLGLECVNDPNPPSTEVLKAYLNQFERFEPGQFNLLDSAAKYISATDATSSMATKIHFYYLKQDYNQLIQLVSGKDLKSFLATELNKSSLSNEHAWAAYRLGEAFSYVGQPNEAFQCYAQAVKLAPYFPDFQNKKGSAALQLGQNNEAFQIFQELTIENPMFTQAWSNLGYMHLMKGDAATAMKLYNYALSLNPDYVAALMNKSGLLLSQNYSAQAKETLRRILKVDPGNQKATEILRTLP